MGANVDMHADGVFGAGRDVSNLAHEAGGKVGRSLDDTIDAGRVSAGWATSVTATGCAQAWEQHLAQLVEQVSTVGDSLNASAMTTTGGDADAAQRLNSVLGDLSS